MNPINMRKVLSAGALAGLAMLPVDMLLNGGLLSDRWDEAMARLNLPPFSEGGWISFVLLVALELMMGWLLAFTYAAFRSRFGPGPRTALLVGLVIWLPGLSIFVSLAMMGIFTWSMIGVSMLPSLAVALVGAYVAGRFYSEG